MSLDQRTALTDERPPLDLDRAVAEEILRLVRSLRYGAIEIVVHDGRIVQIERREKIRTSELLGPHTRPDAAKEPDPPFVQRRAGQTAGGPQDRKGASHEL